MINILEKKKPSSSTKYAYLVGRVRMLERGLLTNRILENASKAEVLEQAIRLILELPYISEVLQNIQKNPPAIDLALIQHWWATIREISHHKLGMEISTFFQMWFDFNDLKLIIKRHLVRQAGGKEYPGSFDWKKVARYVSGETGEFLNDIYRKSVDEALASYEAGHNTQSIEIILDRSFLSETLRIAEASESTVIRNWLQAYVMFAFLRAAFRAKYQQLKIDIFRNIYVENPYLRFEDLNQIITEPEEKVKELVSNLGFGSFLPQSDEYRNDPYYLAEIERNMDNHLMQVIRSYRTQAFGPEPVFGFLYAKTIDIRNLRILLHGKYFGIKETDLKEKFRECYYD